MLRRDAARSLSRAYWSTLKWQETQVVRHQKRHVDVEGGHRLMSTLTAKWTRLASLPGAARSSHRLSALGGKAYLFGGEATARTSIDSTVHCLDPTDNSWRSILPAHVPPPRVAHAQAAIRGKLVIFGGRSGIEMGEHELRDLWEFDPVTESWTELAPAGGTPPSARSFHAATAVGDTLYVFGGCGAEGRLADLHAFSTTNRSWTALPPPPDVAGRGGATLEATADGSALWLIGGFAGHETNDLLRFDLSECTWERKPSEWLRPRSVSASIPLGRSLLLFGGEVSPSDRGHEGAGGFASDLVAIDPHEGVPLCVVIGGASGTPLARGWAAAAALSETEGVLYGGLTGTDDAPVRLNDAWLLRVGDGAEAACDSA